MKDEPLNAIDITLILRGDSRFETALPAADPLLADLHAAVQQPSPSRLMQVPLDGGRTALSFASTELVSVLTTPPVIIEAADSQASLQTGIYLPCVCIDDFLTPDENIKLLQYALDNESVFSPSDVTTGHEGYRRSMVLQTIQDSPWRTLFEDRLDVHLGHIGQTLGIDTFAVGKREIQLTASGNGDFFKLHRDAGEDDGTAARTLTYVYYFFREPQGFSGGNLLLTDDSGANGQGKVLAMRPQNNRLVAFRADQLHEVEPVFMADDIFSERRFTVNGWLRATD